MASVRSWGFCNLLTLTCSWEILCISSSRLLHFSSSLWIDLKGRTLSQGTRPLPRPLYFYRRQDMEGFCKLGSSSSFLEPNTRAQIMFMTASRTALVMSRTSSFHFGFNSFEHQVNVIVDNTFFNCSSTQSDKQYLSSKINTECLAILLFHHINRSRIKPPFETNYWWCAK